MIGRLSGILLEKQPPHILLDVQGVGYELDATMSTFYQLPALGEKVTLHTHMVVREDAQLLYAFADKRGRELFRDDPTHMSRHGEADGRGQHGMT